jgi:predicted nucleotidyltransferase
MLSSTESGLVVVFEGKRTRVRVFRRFFYPVQVKDEDVDVVVYSDTGQEREVTYRRAEEYGLDNPLRLVAMIRLARAMKVLKTDPAENNVQNLRFTICRSIELIGPDAENDEWMPFDPTRIRPLDERIRDAKKRVRWRQRLKKQ